VLTGDTAELRKARGAYSPRRWSMLQTELRQRLRKGTAGGIATASANIMGENYLKQVDVIMSSWQSGPELLICTCSITNRFLGPALPPAPAVREFSSAQESYLFSWATVRLQLKLFGSANRHKTFRRSPPRLSGIRECRWSLVRWNCWMSDYRWSLNG